MSKPIYNIEDIVTFTICPLKLKNLSKIEESSTYYIGDENLMLGAVLKKTFLYYAMSFVTQYQIKSKTVFSKFSALWTEYRHVYNKLGYSSIGNVENISQAYDAVAKFRQHLPKGSEVCLVNMPYVKSFKDFDIKDTVDIVFVHKLGKTNATEIEIVTIDSDITRPSRTSLLSRVRSMMQEVMVRRELASHDVKIRSSILNLYTGNKQSVSLAREHRLNYRRILRQICSAMSDGADYPTPTKYNCARCVFSRSCTWSDS